MQLTFRTALALVAAALVTTPHSAAQPAPPASAPSRGSVVPAFDTMTVDGTPTKIDFPKGSKTVLLFFLSGCELCERTLPEWNRAFERKPGDVRVFGIIMNQEPPGFWQVTSIRFPVLRAPVQPFLRELNVHRAPLTLRVGEGGKIEDLAVGAVGAARLRELFDSQVSIHSPAVDKPSMR